MRELSWFESFTTFEKSWTIDIPYTNDSKMSSSQKLPQIFSLDENKFKYWNKWHKWNSSENSANKYFADFIIYIYFRIISRISRSFLGEMSSSKHKVIQPGEQRLIDIMASIALWLTKVNVRYMQIHINLQTFWHENGILHQRKGNFK